jgi:hypothetical protein
MSRKIKIYRLKDDNGNCYVSWTLGDDPITEHRTKKLIPLIHENIDSFDCVILAQTPSLGVAENLTTVYRQLYKPNIDE